MFNKDNKLSFDIIIVDEVSMIGGSIFYKLIQSIKTGAKLVLLGDEGQLESIGFMNILNDLLKSDNIQSCQLTKIHRQAQRSGIIEASMKVRNKEQLFGNKFTGKMIIGELQDCELNITNDRAELPQLIEDQFKMWLDKVNDISSLQVIAPMRDRGSASCYPLNKMLQEIYNPVVDGENTKRLTLTKDKKEYEIRIKDKVINRKNNYKALNVDGIPTPIFNGNIGIVKDIDESTRTIVVDFQGIGEVVIDNKNISNVELGYVVTTHSAQGSQWDVVLYCLDHSSYQLLNKEQIYTGITRSSKYCVIIAENKSLRYGISTSEIKNKQTFLNDLLRELSV